MIMLGRDRLNGGEVFIDDSRARAVLICGKRGSGKSYTMGVLLEELVKRDDSLVIALDPMRNFHTMVLPNIEQERLLWDWDMFAEGVPVRLLVPGDPYRRYGQEIVKVFEERGVEVLPLRLNPGDLPPDGWLDLFGIDIATPMGLALYRAVSKLQRSHEKFFTVSDIIAEIHSDPLIRETSIQALVLRLETAANDWDLFSTRYHDLLEVFRLGAVNVVDLGVLEVGRRNLVVAVLVRDLFRKRREARLQEELGIPTQVPKIWPAIDEAQEFVPSGRSALAKEPLIQWVKEGRQPGLSLIIASQQPGAIDKEVLSQCDLILCHKVTAMEDVDAINRLSHDYMAHELRHYIRQLERTGEAVMVDDFRETVTVVQIRPRKSKHGGAEV
ncbi:MAG: hypothetical protein HZLCBSQH_000094 [Candidatus Fervidibacterota bacterium]